ncbi:MAG: hypothetical protein LBM00_06025 [Deltaproteobacteria bacterium]|jgi:hypothetical protein|nr:hypothetical protein [Deltaproteobacteria bacterium]
MQSTIALFNLAIARLGGEQIPLNISPQEHDATGDLCQNLFPHVLDLALSAHQWSFAKKRVRLALPEVKEAVSGEYALMYKLPADCGRVCYLEGFEGPNRRPAYVIEGDRLLTGREAAELVYIARASDPRLWPPAFADALAWGLAGELAAARINDSRKQSWCYQNYKQALSEAIAQDQSGQNRLRPVSAWNAARFGETNPEGEK